MRFTSHKGHTSCRMKKGSQEQAGRLISIGLYVKTDEVKPGSDTGNNVQVTICLHTHFCLRGYIPRSKIDRSKCTDVLRFLISSVKLPLINAVAIY